MMDLGFLIDVDNTLLDNDRLKAELDQQIRGLIGDEATQQFWNVYETVRKNEEYVDFPATLSEFAIQRPDLPLNGVTKTVMGVDFASFLYPGAIETLHALEALGLVAIVSDGDPVFQRLKIERSGLAAAVDNRVQLTVHKQKEMDSVFSQFPAEHYAMIDDKTTILADVGRLYPDRITTVLVCQGKYASLRATPGPDVVVPHIADAATVPREAFLGLVPT